MGTRWRTSWKRPEGAAPTALVGESAEASDGCSSSSWRSSRTSRSYSESGISGESSVWYSSLWCLMSARSSSTRAADVLVAGHRQAAMPAPTTASGSSAS